MMTMALPATATVSSTATLIMNATKTLIYKVRSKATWSVGGAGQESRLERKLTAMNR